MSCRKCHRPDHIPKTCEEVEADEKVRRIAFPPSLPLTAFQQSNNIHKVEEAVRDTSKWQELALLTRVLPLQMSEALIRRCPKCHQPFVKEDGCTSKPLLLDLPTLTDVPQATRCPQAFEPKGRVC